MNHHPSSALAPLTYAWLGLVVLTLISPLLAELLQGAVWLQLLVAAIIWLKGWLIAHQFIEIHLAHPFIRRVTLIFVAFTPLALLLTVFFGDQFARWATL
jgi:sorbitol-specific phosphotransferase system component IIBC